MMLIFTKEFIEKLIERLEEAEKDCVEMYDWAGQSAIIEAKEIVNQLAEEYKGGWIPVSERFPEESEYVLAFVLIITPYHDICYWKNGTITHWQPLPYQPKGE